MARLVSAQPRSARLSRPTAIVAAPVGFLLVYLASSPVSDALADRPLPLPMASAAETAAYFAANPLAVAVLAVMQVISVACFAVFVAAIKPKLDGLFGSRLPSLGYLSVATMVLSSLCAGAASVAASAGSIDLVDQLRQASFYAGGVANVVTLGAFVFGSALIFGGRALVGEPTRWFGSVAGALAMLSLLSLGIYYASVLLPVGRVLSMLWTVAAGIRLVHGRSTDLRR